MYFLLLLAYAAFFLAQMSLGAKKMPRYVLPSILALDVLAAAGIVTWARRLADGRRGLALALMGIPHEISRHGTLVYKEDVIAEDGKRYRRDVRITMSGMRVKSVDLEGTK